MRFAKPNGKRKSGNVTIVVWCGGVGGAVFYFIFYFCLIMKFIMILRPVWVGIKRWVGLFEYQ